MLLFCFLSFFLSFFFFFRFCFLWNENGMGMEGSRGRMWLFFLAPCRLRHALGRLLWFCCF
ncbi:hypothetical protein BDV36DRAFT_252027, partial [Aspergillus pseudocaelatus]